MPEPGTSFISASWLKPLWKMLTKIRDQREVEIQKITNTFADPYDLARFYVEPNCQQHNPADHLEDLEPRSTVKSPVFKTINNFLEGEYAVTGDGKNQFFILSDAGMGKTSLMVMLKLAHLTNFWPGRYDCVLLKLGKETLDEVRGIKTAGQTVLLLDALDEDVTAWGRIRERLLELLAATKHFRRVIISCRTQFFPQTSADPFANPGRVSVGGFTCPMIFISLFDSEQIEEYIQKRYSSSLFTWWRTSGKRKAASQLVTKMRDLSCRPMLLAHIEDLVTSEVQHWSEYSVYQALVDAWLNREERKLREAGEHGITREMLLNACQLVAENMFIDGSRFMSEEALNELTNSHPQLSKLTQLRFGGRSLLNRNSDGAYRFSHFSIQEFILAQCVILRARDSRVSVHRNLSEKTFRFICDGCIGTLRAIDLIRNISFADSDISDFNFRGGDLFGLAFAGIDLENSDFTNCKCTNVDFRNSSLLNANFTDAILKNCDFRGAKLDNARFISAKLSGVILDSPVSGHSFFHYTTGTEKIHFHSFAWSEGNTLEVPTTKYIKSNLDLLWISDFPIRIETIEEVVVSAPDRKDIVEVLASLFPDRRLQQSKEANRYMEPLDVAKYFCLVLNGLHPNLSTVCGRRLHFRLPSSNELAFNWHRVHVRPEMKSKFDNVWEWSEDGKLVSVAQQRVASPLSGVSTGLVFRLAIAPL